MVYQIAIYYINIKKEKKKRSCMHFSSDQLWTSFFLEKGA